MPTPDNAATDSAWAQFAAGVLTAFSVVLGFAYALIRHIVGGIVAPVKQDIKDLRRDQTATDEAADKLRSEMDDRFNQQARNMRLAIGDLKASVEKSNAEIKATVSETHDSQIRLETMLAERFPKR